MFITIMSLLTVTLFDLREEHQADVEARRVAEIIRGVARLQQAHYQTSNATAPTGRFLTRVDETGFHTENNIPTSGAASRAWAWFHALPDDPTNKTFDDDQNRFSTWATRRWLRDGSGGPDDTGVPLSPAALVAAGLGAGARACCVVDPSSVQVIYEARDAHVAGRVARQFGPSACLGRPHTRTGQPAGGRHWLSYECADAGSADDRYAIVHFSAPTSLTVLGGMVWTDQPTLAGTPRPMYGDIRLREHRPQQPANSVRPNGPLLSTLFDATNPITASITEEGYLYAPGPPDINLANTIGGFDSHSVNIDGNGNLTIGFGLVDQVTLDGQGLTLMSPGATSLSLGKSGGTRTLSGVDKLVVESDAILDASSL